jgi:hypothetical protein
MIIKKTLAVGAVLGLTMFAASAQAVTLHVNDFIKLYDSYGTTGGGEFNADIVGTSSATDFITFCVEYNEYFTPGESLLVQNISTQAVNGGVGGGSPDPLDARTAYLYTRFATHALGSYDYFGTGTDHVSDANSLQRAIWYIEQEISFSTMSSDAQALAWYSEANSAVTSGAWTGTGNVKILNLMRKDGSGNYTVKAQDQLYLTPEPGSMVLIGAGLASLLAYAWKRR